MRTTLACTLVSLSRKTALPERKSPVTHFSALERDFGRALIGALGFRVYGVQGSGSRIYLDGYG